MSMLFFVVWIVSDNEAAASALEVGAKELKTEKEKSDALLQRAGEGVLKTLDDNEDQIQAGGEQELDALDKVVQAERYQKYLKEKLVKVKDLVKLAKTDIDPPGVNK